MSDLIKAHGLLWTPGDRGDDYILKESSYECLFKPEQSSISLRPEDRWLDIGAHFGSFALRAATYVHFVVAVEPHPGNMEQLRENARINEIHNLALSQAAAVAGENDTYQLYLGHTFDYTHRLQKVRGRDSIPVFGKNINEYIQWWDINKIKMDCEGSEPTLLLHMELKPIEEIILEWHFTLIPDPDWKHLAFVLQVLEAEGFTIKKAPDMSRVTKRWTAIIWARKE